MFGQDLEGTIKQMLTPVKSIALSSVIEALSGHKVIPFDSNDDKDRAVLSRCMRACEIAGKNINVHGILRPRPNEVGNDIEPFIREALCLVGCRAYAPLTKSGIKKSAGYPDIEFVDEFGRTNYLECKTYNLSTIATTMRSFYLSPSEDFKVTKDAHHFLVSFEIFVEGTRGDKNVYKCRRWKILSLENLLVNVKYEFNSDNIRLYNTGLTIAEGEI